MAQLSNYLISNLTKVYFILGSICTFLFIFYTDKLIQKNTQKNKINLDQLSENNKEVELNRGLESLQRALDDNILTDDEYEKIKADLISKYR
jgi:hypothetical protein